MRFPTRAALSFLAWVGGMVLAADAGEDSVKVIFADGIPAGSKVR